ncbi:MAG: biopolymer transporter ExbD [Myxococcota bacterium]|jgi:biopolymer transport protein ExbD|nr:biopolymer transporter ExbD [Myxococcota bacterium]
MSEEKASMAQVKRIIRKKIKRHPEHEHQEINIYPMLDMMTILLVFMVMQFSSSTASAISQSSELTIPYSTSRVELGDATPIQISRSAILVDGVQHVTLRDGLVDPSQKQGGGTGFLITPLFREMGRVRDLKKAIAAANPRRPFTGEVQIIADQRTPFRTLAEVIYTLGQTEFNQLRFVANKTPTLGGGGPASAAAAQ